MSGFFVALEGIDGAGKDTLVQTLANFFEQVQGRDRVLLTEEPSQGETGQLIRQMLDKKVSAPSTNFEFQRLFVRDRREHLETVIRPALKSGMVVVSARYWLSTLAYGILEGPVEQYLDLHREVIGEQMLVPDLTLLLDLDPEIGLERIRAAGRHFDHFAKLGLLERIRANYLDLVRRQEELGLGEIVVVDAVWPKKYVFDAALRVIIRRLLEQKEG
ncbi:MAG TPA: dTMP kinase [Candidatus Paceibacterota bacterium]